MAFISIFLQIKLVFGVLVIQLVWYILKQLFTLVSVKVVDIYLPDICRLGKYPPLFTSTLVNIVTHCFTECYHVRVKSKQTYNKSPDGIATPQCFY